jgi:hypothetical protein
MTFAEYKKAFYAAAEAAHVDVFVHPMGARNKIIAEYLPLSILQAVVRSEVVEDTSVILNNRRSGLLLKFTPHWIEICEEEIIERLITDKS